MTVWPILAASLVGSPHCAAMCGMIAGAAGRRAGPIAAYHGSRLAGYVALGTVAGVAGAATNRIGEWSGWASAATRVAGIALVAFGLLGILTSLGRGPRLASAHRWAGNLAARGRDLPPTRRAVVLGLVTALLPCGWLFAFVAAAAGTGKPGDGALAMAVFWLGTVPAVASAGALIGRLAGPLRRRLPALAGAVLVIFGLLTAFGRAPAGPPSDRPTSHDHGAR